MFDDEAKTAALVQSVNLALRKDYPHLGCGEAVPAARGLSFLVCRAESAIGPLAVRVPYGRSVTSTDRARQRACRLLDQEAFLARYSASAGIPAARVHVRHHGPALDFVVSDYVEVDGTEADGFEVGRLLARLHGLPPPRWHCVETRGRGVARMLADRIKRRLRIAERLMGLTLAFSAEAAFAALAGAPRRRCLLHMDVRPENWLVRGGSVAAIVDWENALIGHPALELARISECGLLDPELMAGYRSVAPLEEVPPAADLLYRLDTALLLVGVYTLATPDETKARVHGERVLELHGRLGAELGD